MNSAKNIFEFVSYSINKDQQTIEFTYSLTTTSQQRIFTERIVFSESNISDLPAELLDSILHSLHLMLGISYWKLLCPTEISIKTKPLSKEQATFWNTIYTKGLGEFFYKNNIDFRNLVNFPYEDIQPNKIISFSRKNRSLVGIGGGKDSIVVAELCKKNNKDFSNLIIDTQKPHIISQGIATKNGKEIIIVKRYVDSQLFDLNKDPAFYNGHIPISAVYAFIAVLTAGLYDYSYVLVGNERSANYGNTEYLGESINHQWSKTYEFEKLFQTYISTYITSDITYFSLLRPFSEYKITQLFTQFPQYYSSFSSCNRNYAIQKELPTTKWCGGCPKCAFVFAMLAAFISKEEVLAIFSRNLFEKVSLIEMYKELLGIEGIKPFECVGTPEEVLLAFYKVYKNGEFEQSVVMQMFIKEVLPKLKDIDEVEKEVLANGEDLVPKEFREIINI